MTSVGTVLVEVMCVVITDVLRRRSLTHLVITVKQGERNRSAGYEGLDAADMESIQRPPPPHHYVGLRVNASEAGLDHNGYMVPVVDSAYVEQLRVSSEVTVIIIS